MVKEIGMVKKKSNAEILSEYNSLSDQVVERQMQGKGEQQESRGESGKKQYPRPATTATALITMGKDEKEFFLKVCRKHAMTFSALVRVAVAEYIEKRFGESADIC